MAENPTIEDLKAPLLAAVGAADLALATVNEILAGLRERAGEVRTEAAERVEERRAALTKLQDDLPQRAEELRGRLSSEELRKAADSFFEDATATYNSLVERGEAALERLRSQPDFKEAAAQVEGYVDQAVELTQEALGSVSSQTRAVGERAAKLVGVELPAGEAPAEKAPAKAAAAKKAPANAAANEAPANDAPAKKAPAKKVTQK
ncbi:heparin-binding hemagglutinin [Candidatus Mycolicibacterium alkanivorans]|uniref:Heparin-binding hemagglutinin n=1 Tax=Candidatus Mycolicibacterium alkanivorans TaxID=2954114 RepID=A0ABS9YQY7_9MYCO|nr:heparin-binding hemagglutinin [Candidatus Mycolicibacterium alkanivorans]MCI4673607.1 heparin-binding hemagglutinin [Candidatus Mycolicibacterium alkanivorans]